MFPQDKEGHPGGSKAGQVQHLWPLGHLLLLEFNWQMMVVHPLGWALGCQHASTTVRQAPLVHREGRRADRLCLDQKELGVEELARGQQAQSTRKGILVETSAGAKAWVHEECGVFGKGCICFWEAGRGMLKGGGLAGDEWAGPSFKKGFKFRRGLETWILKCWEPLLWLHNLEFWQLSFTVMMRFLFSFNKYLLRAFCA